MSRNKGKDLTADERLKFEIAEELGLYEQVMEKGWRSLTAKQAGRIGGIMAKRKKELSKEKETATRMI